MITPELVEAKTQEMLRDAAEMRRQEAARARPEKDTTAPRASVFAVRTVRIPRPSVILDWIPFL